jgi:hypothetical protein
MEQVRLHNEPFHGEPFPNTQRSLQMVGFDGYTTLRGFDLKKVDIILGAYSAYQLGPPSTLGQGRRPQGWTKAKDIFPPCLALLTENCVPAMEVY